MSAEFDFKAAYHKEHDDFCKVESRNYVLEQRIQTLEAENGALIDLRDAREVFIASLALQLLRLRTAEEALREIAVASRTHETVSYWTDVEVEMLKDIARKALGEE